MSTSNKLFQAASGNAGEAIYVEDVYSTHIYKGTGSSLSINNGIDLNGEGGLTWIKNRDQTDSHVLTDTERGVTKILSSNSSSGQTTDSDTLTAFNSDGFTLGADVKVNTSGEDYVSWSFRKQAGFFDIVKYTGNGTAGNTVSHNLGSVPGMILVKRTGSSKDWWVYHVGSNNGNSPETKYQKLNGGPHNEADSTTAWNDTAPTATQFTLGTSTNVNADEEEHIAYLFANNDQSFGDDSDEAIVKCGHFSANGSGEADVNLGFEPQWIIFKRHNSSTAGDWFIVDNMRGWHAEDRDSIRLKANDNTSEGNFAIFLNATGFTGNGFAASGAYIYTAIRRPMKTPEVGTEVFKAVARSGNSTAGTSITCGFPLDWVVTQGRSAAIEPISYTRLQSNRKKLLIYLTSSEGSSGTNVITSFDQDGMTVGTDTDINNSSYTYINWFFKRATGFFDVVAYTGNGTSNTTQNHNLGVAPELLIIKDRDAAERWVVYSSALGASKALYLNENFAAVTDSGQQWWGNPATSPTSTVFTLGNDGTNNSSGRDYIAYLFATVAGVSKVGSYTGTGSNVDVNCGFSSTARFVLIKRTDSTGDWYVYDHARGIVAGNDPFQEWNNAAAETGSTDYIDPLSTGFTITSSAPADLNTSGGTYIFLAIAQVTHGIQSTFKR